MHIEELTCAVSMYKILSIFLVFGASAIGCGICFLRQDKETKWSKIVKMFSAGVIVSLAMVHILYEASTEMSEVIEYPLANVCALSAFIIFMIIEHLSHSWTSFRDRYSSEMSSCALMQHRMDDEEQVTPQLPRNHEHTCINNRPAIIQNTYNKTKSVVLFEVACILHSIFIGISLGVTTSPSTVKTMMIAIIFHQFLEGISLGYVLMEANVSKVKAVVMMFLYALTTPIGIVVGMSINNHSILEQKTNIMVTGTFQAISSGLLMYVALFQIIAEELTKNELHELQNRSIKYGMYASLLMGIASMCILAMWM